MIRIGLLAAVAVLVGASVGCGGAVNGGDPIDYSAQSFDGADVSTVDLRGKPALLTSWATWCAVCKTELPKLERFTHTPEARGLQVVVVNVNAEGATYMVRRMASQLRLTMPTWADPDNNYTGFFRGVGVPTTVLLDAQGRVTHLWQGSLDVDDPETIAEIRATLAGG
jgi:thiol-disulfide isomerase/thioredoxin